MPLIAQRFEVDCLATHEQDLNLSRSLTTNLNLNEESTQELHALQVLGQCEATPSSAHLALGWFATQLQYLLIIVPSFITVNRKDESEHGGVIEVFLDDGDSDVDVGTIDGDDVWGGHTEQVSRQVFEIPSIEHLVAVSISMNLQDRYAVSPLKVNLKFNDESAQVPQFQQVLGQCDATPSRAHLTFGWLLTQLHDRLMS